MTGSQANRSGTADGPPMTPGEQMLAAILNEMVGAGRVLRERLERVVGELDAIERDAEALKKKIRRAVEELPQR